MLSRVVLSRVASSCAVHSHVSRFVSCHKVNVSYRIELFRALPCPVVLNLFVSYRVLLRHFLLCFAVPCCLVLFIVVLCRVFSRRPRGLYYVLNPVPLFSSRICVVHFSGTCQMSLTLAMTGDVQRHHSVPEEQLLG